MRKQLKEGTPKTTVKLRCLKKGRRNHEGGGDRRFKASEQHPYYVKTALGVLEGQGIQTELISLQGKEIKPCTGCYDCTRQGRCTIEGDDFDEILEKMRTAEGLILGSPVYLSSVVPQMMALLGRATFVAY
jgi:hypothetical protein